MHPLHRRASRRSDFHLRRVRGMGKATPGHHALPCVGCGDWYAASPTLWRPNLPAQVLATALRCCHHLAQPQIPPSLSAAVSRGSHRCRRYSHPTPLPSLHRRDDQAQGPWQPASEAPRTVRPRLMARHCLPLHAQRCWHPWHQLPAPRHCHQHHRGGPQARIETYQTRNRPLWLVLCQATQRHQPSHGRRRWKMPTARRRCFPHEQRG